MPGKLLMFLTLSFMIFRILLLLCLTLTLACGASAWSQDLTGQWILTMQNRSHEPVTTLTIEFTQQKSRSCMSGNWLQLAVVSASSKDKQFFPYGDPLSYSIENNRLTIGRNGICDAYLMMSGAIGGSEIHGDYYAFGLGGSESLGYFALHKKKGSN